MVGTSRNTAVLQRGRFIWRLILRFNKEGLEFKVVFISYARTCGSTVWKTDSTQGILSQEATTPNQVNR